MLACAAPEILVAAVAAATSRIRVGSGGVMLSHYSPFKVAEVFSVIAGLHGKRIDLGVGRAPGGDLETIYALQRDRRQLLPEDYARAGRGAPRLLRGRVPARPSARAGSRGCRARPGAPEVWLLGTSPDSAVMGGRARAFPTRSRTSSTPAAATSGRLYRELFVPVAAR